LPYTLYLRDDYLTGIESAGLILASQNWFNYASNRPRLFDAVSNGVPLHGVVELAMDLFPGVRLGVTGSNGKSTTCGLLANLLRTALPDDRQLFHGGNDRKAQANLIDLAAAMDLDCLVWEVSNRHLRTRPVPVDIAVLTNVTANHIEDHGSWDEYVTAKARLVLHASEASVISVGDTESMKLLKHLRNTVWLAGGLPGASQDRPHRGLAWVDGETVMVRRPHTTEHLALGSVRSLPLPGEHNARNLLSAVCAALAAGAEPSRLEDAWSCFAPMAGRLEEVANHEDVRWVYDIQATTAPASEAGLLALGGNGESIVLLVGGEDKGMDYSGMADAAASVGRAVVQLPGSGSEGFVTALAGRLPVLAAEDLDEGLATARTLAEPGDAVLLSPGAAHFQSRFIDGGPSFARRVRTLLGIG
jgi:UDP-N-acetylmuramoylalanine--D-glutamate ligase